MRDILLYGAGGHARVIIDIIEKSENYNIVGLVDDTENRVDSVMGYPVFSGLKDLCNQGVRSGIIAVGDNWHRRRLETLIIQNYSDFEFVCAIHPSTNIGKNVSIMHGTVIMAGCSINSDVKISKHCVINTGATVDHDCIVENFASLAPGVTLGGSVRVGECTAISLGASLIHNITIGKHTVIGAGSVVVKNMPSHVTAYGNPCRIVRNRVDGESYL